MAKLVIVSGTGVGRELPLAESSVIGRQSDCDVVLAEESVSRRHARVFLENGKHFVEDLGSTNGTFVNGKLVERSELHDQDVLATGNFMFTFHVEEGSGTSAVGRTVISFRQEDDAPGSRVLKVIDAKGYDLSKDTASVLTKDDLAAIQRRIATVNRITQTMATTLDLDEILSRVLGDLFEVFPQAERGYVLLLDKETGEPVPKAVKLKRAGGDQKLQMSRTILNAVVRDKKSVLSADAAEDSRFMTRQSILDFNIHSVMCAPLLYQNQILGALHLDTSQVARHFEQDDLALLTAIASQAAMVIANAQMHEALLHRQRIDQDLRFAQRVQKSFLPGKLPQTQGYTFKTYYTAAYEVGGDFYDVIESGPGTIGIVIGDVAGKGISAALMMAHITSQIRSYAFRNLSPEEILSGINARLESGVESQFVTVLYACLNTQTGDVHFANGGHPPPAVRRADGRVEFVEEPSNFPIGITEDVAFEGSTFPLEGGDVVFLCTDGVIEAMNNAQECYGIERMLKAIGGAPGTPDAVLNAVLADVHNFAAGASQSDDLTMLAFGRDSS
ncbi:MAG: SpoIIE family protein phosphatase [Planctomycetota bacterium]